MVWHHLIRWLWNRHARKLQYSKVQQKQQQHQGFVWNLWNCCSYILNTATWRVFHSSSGVNILVTQKWVTWKWLETIRDSLSSFLSAHLRDSGKFVRSGHALEILKSSFLHSFYRKQICRTVVTICHSVPSPPFRRRPLCLFFSLTVCSQLDFSVSGCRGQGSHFLYQQEDSQPSRTATTAFLTGCNGTKRTSCQRSKQTPPIFKCTV